MRVNSQPRALAVGEYVPPRLAGALCDLCGSSERADGRSVSASSHTHAIEREAPHGRQPVRVPTSLLGFRQAAMRASEARLAWLAALGCAVSRLGGRSGLTAPQPVPYHRRHRIPVDALLPAVLRLEPVAELFGPFVRIARTATPDDIFR